MVAVNNLKYGNKHFKSKLSFRKKGTWISEPDMLVVSANGLNLLDSFDMLQYFNGRHLYYDHALLEYVINTEQVSISTELLKQRADCLGSSIYEAAPIKINETLR